jgi:hypothetical protein
MVSRIQAGASERHPSLVATVRALRSGAADAGNARDLLPPVGRSKNERTHSTRVASRRRGRCELSLVSVMLRLLQEDRSLLARLLSFTKFKLDTTIDNVS